jgi:pimeloyl-ACP methyl ester carboxylesterase
VSPASPDLYKTPPILSSWSELLDGIETQEDWEQKRTDLHARYLELLRDEARPERPPVEIRRENTVTVDGVYERHSLTFRVDKDEWAHAYLGIPLEVERPLPGVVALHGTTAQGTDQTAGLTGNPDKAFLDFLCRRGFAVIAPEHFVSGRRIPAEGPYHTRSFYEKHPHWTAVGKSVFEHSLALDVLLTRPEVAPDRVGCMGHSLGGHGAFFLAAYDERIRAVAGNCAGATFRHNPDRDHWSRDHWYVYFPQLRSLILEKKRLPIDFHEILALIAPRPLLDLYALNDGDAGCQRQRVLMSMAVAGIYDLLEAPRHFAFFVHGHGHAVPRESRELIAAFLVDHTRGV